MHKHLIFLGFILLAYFSKAQKADHVVVKYLFNNGNIRDEIGRFNPRVYGVKLVEDRFGNRKSACYLQGNNDSYLNLGTSNLLKPKKGTISLWVKINQPIYKGQGMDYNPIIWTRANKEEDFNEAFYMGYHLNLKNININTSYSERDVVTLYPTGPTSLLNGIML